MKGGRQREKSTQQDALLDVVEIDRASMRKMEALKVRNGCLSGIGGI